MRTWPATEELLKWGGLVLVFLAAVFAVSTAIERGWIGPQLQLAGAVLFGSGLIGGGLHLGRERTAWGHPLVGAGLAVLFTSAGAAHGWLDLVPLAATGVGIVGVSAGGFALSRILDRQWIALNAFAGLILIPIFLHAWDTWSGSTLAGGLVVATLAALMLSIERDWPILRLTALFTSLTLMLPTAGSAIGAEAIGHRVLMTAAALVLASAWWASSELVLWQARGSIRRSVNADTAAPNSLWICEALTVVGVPTWLWAFITALLSTSGGNQHAAGWLALGLATVFGSIAFAIRPVVSREHWLAQITGVSALVTISLPLLLVDRGSNYLSALLVTLVGQTLISLVLTRRYNSRLLFANTIGLGLVSGSFGLIRTLAAIRADGSALDHSANLVVVGALAFTAWLLGQTEPARPAQFRTLQVTTLGALMLWLLSVLVHFPQGQVLVTISWATIGIAVLVGGAMLKRSDAGVVGLGVLGITMAKLLTVDLTEVDTFWRAGLFLVVGAGLLRVAYALPKLSGIDDTPEPISPMPPPPTPQSTQPPGPPAPQAPQAAR